MDFYGIKEVNCKQCSKLIIPTPQWVYKIRRKDSSIDYFCTYSCYKKAGGDNAPRFTVRRHKNETM